MIFLIQEMRSITFKRIPTQHERKFILNTLLFQKRRDISLLHREFSSPHSTIFAHFSGLQELGVHGKNGFVTATKLGTSDKIFVAATKQFAAATKRFVDRTKHFVVVTKSFCYPYFNK